MTFVFYLKIAQTKDGKGPSVNDFIVRAAALALLDVPEGFVYY